MAQPDQEIRSLLQARLAALTSVPVKGSVKQIAWENRGFTPDPATPWLRVTVQWADQIGEHIFSQRVTDLGNLLVDCFAPEHGGPEPADALAAAVRAQFPIGLSLQGTSVRVLIERNSRAAGQNGPQDDPGFFVPVTVRWRASYVAG